MIYYFISLQISTENQNCFWTQRNLLLLILQKLLLLVVLDLLDLLQLLQLTLLLEAELLLLLLRQEMSCRLPVEPISSHNVGARSGRCHTGRVIGDGLPGVRGREAVVALGDVCVRPHLCWWVVQYLIWKINIHCSWWVDENTQTE